MIQMNIEISILTFIDEDSSPTNNCLGNTGLYKFQARIYFGQQKFWTFLILDKSLSEIRNVGNFDNSYKR